MTTRDSQLSVYRDAWIQTPHGRLFTRYWSPTVRKTSSGNTPIVLFHDSLGCVDIWRGFSGRLCESTGRDVIAYDRLGHGKSDPRPVGSTLNFIHEEAEIYFPALRQQLNVDRFVAFGHSVGGAMAALCAANFSDACDALVTESAQAFVEDITLEGVTKAKTLFQEPGQIDRLKRYHGEKAQSVVNAWTDTWLAPEFASWKLDPALPHVRCRVLAIHGQHDEYGSTRHPETIARLAGGSTQVEILPECGHVPHREQEETVLRLVATFLR